MNFQEKSTNLAKVQAEMYIFLQVSCRQF